VVDSGIAGGLPAAPRSEGEVETRIRAIRPFLEEGVPHARLAEEQGRSLRTMRYWVARYRRAGIAGLARKRRSDRGQRLLNCSVKARVVSLWLGSKHRPVASIYRQGTRARRTA
jgi:putative transposase